MQQETEKELNSQIKKWGKTLRNEEPVIVEENQKQNWQNFCEQVFCKEFFSAGLGRETQSIVFLGNSAKSTIVFWRGNEKTILFFNYFFQFDCIFW